jgi:hypothetical protein
VIIGVDFDNTIADYDDLMRNLALEERWIDAAMSSKQDIRDHIRLLNDGEIKWQKLQAKVYGKHMRQAKLIDGVKDFFVACRAQGVPVFIVSHKTPFAAQDEDNINLHEASLSWMKEKRFFQEDSEGLALPKSHVFFELTRQQKVQRIKALGCTHVIDDLKEVFLEEGFPSSIEKILYAPQGLEAELEGMTVMNSWKKIHEHVFNR